MNPNNPLLAPKRLEKHTSWLNVESVRFFYNRLQSRQAVGHSAKKIAFTGSKTAIYGGWMARWLTHFLLRSYLPLTLFKYHCFLSYEYFAVRLLRTCNPMDVEPAPYHCATQLLQYFCLDSSSCKHNTAFYINSGIDGRTAALQTYLLLSVLLVYVHSFISWHVYVNCILFLAALLRPSTSCFLKHYL